jgi:hypothetical protein
MFLTAADLAADLNSWLVVGPQAWSELLREQDVQSDEVLQPYVVEVAREADEHARACQLATESHGPPWRLETSRRSDGRLEHFAWLAGIRERLDDPSEWWTYTHRSGPLMGLLREDFWHRPGYETYLEFMCFDKKRVLCLKLGGASGDLRPIARDALAAVDHLDWQRLGRMRTGKSCTAGWLDFTELGAAESANRTREAVAAVASAAAG